MVRKKNHLFGVKLFKSGRLFKVWQSGGKKKNNDEQMYLGLDMRTVNKNCIPNQYVKSIKTTFKNSVTKHVKRQRQRGDCLKLSHFCDVMLVFLLLSTRRCTQLKQLLYSYKN